jgi:hypothetical protein
MDSVVMKRGGWKSEFYLHWNCHCFSGRPLELANAFKVLVEHPPGAAGDFISNLI